MDILHEPWPWYVGGPAIAFTMFLLIFLGKEFGVSANLRTIVCMCGGKGASKFFDFDWKKQSWNLAFLIGTVLGAWLTSEFMKSDEPMALSSAFLTDLETLGVAAPVAGQIEPTSLFNWGQLATTTGIIMLLVGGFLVGFGARYAGGCTSGHAISGLSNLQLPSLIAVIGFFIGGLIVTFFIYPWLLNL